jgi:hypothetical protein
MVQIALKVIQHAVKRDKKGRLTGSETVNLPAGAK